MSQDLEQAKMELGSLNSQLEESKQELESLNQELEELKSDYQELLDEKEAEPDEMLEETEEDEIEQEMNEQEVPHREGMKGVSDKKISDTESSFNAQKVRNDVTGKWKVCTIAENINIVEYALDYYKKRILNDDEIHAIVNFNYMTTTCIQYMSGQLYVTVHEYVDGEEHDANKMFSGMVLEDYIVYPDNGDIQQIK